jgi:hypothetical protein
MVALSSRLCAHSCLMYFFSNLIKQVQLLQKSTDQKQPPWRSCVPTHHIEVLCHELLLLVELGRRGTTHSDTSIMDHKMYLF